MNSNQSERTVATTMIQQYDKLVRKDHLYDLIRSTAVTTGQRETAFELCRIRSLFNPENERKSLVEYTRMSADPLHGNAVFTVPILSKMDGRARLTHAELEWVQACFSRSADDFDQPVIANEKSLHKKVQVYKEIQLGSLTFRPYLLALSDSKAPDDIHLLRDCMFDLRSDDCIFESLPSEAGLAGVIVRIVEHCLQPAAGLDDIQRNPVPIMTVRLLDRQLYHGRKDAFNYDR